MVDISWEAPKGWAQILVDDYRWLRFHTDPSKRPADPTSEGLVKFVRHHPRDFQVPLRAAINKAKVFEREVLRTEIWTHKLHNIAKGTPLGASATPDAVFVCQ
eukprot:1814536-Pyramimonas_sp.AAC.1